MKLDVTKEITYNKAGLVPEIVQQHDSGEVLMLAWMNKESIKETLKTKQVCYWSRSHRKLWREGESSGHIQRLVEFCFDCDKDSILTLVDQTGPACHTNRPNCFYNSVNNCGIEVINKPIK